MSTPDTSPQLRLAVLTLFPEMFSAITQWGVTGRAFASGLCQLHLQDPRDEASDRHGTVDDRPYGGGPGMVMKAPILADALNKARAVVGERAKVIAMSPQGKKLDASLAQSLASEGRLIVVAGSYEGIDERFIARHVDLEVSVGDYVVSGGELPAMILIDALIRWLPGALGHEASAAEDSFSEALLDCPHYTRPEVYEGIPVPPVLLSGHHGEIAEWRRAQALRRTLDRRPDLLTVDGLSDVDLALLNKWDLLRE
ncbi:MAG: tRNA (guanosine(37)-N1)-methyltransferase TrmD [Halieaceae bacterium]